MSLCFKRFRALQPSSSICTPIGSPDALLGLKAVGADIELRSDWEASGMGDVHERRLNGTVVSMTLALKTVVDSMWPDVPPNDPDYGYYSDTPL